MSTRQTYIPPLRFQVLTPLYDPLLAWVMREATFKRRLIEVLRPEPGERLLDLGCGTGTLTVWLRQAYPAVQVFGLDMDTEALRLARAKAAPYAAGVQLQQASATALPYQDLRRPAPWADAGGWLTRRRGARHLLDRAWRPVALPRTQEDLVNCAEAVDVTRCTIMPRLQGPAQARPPSCRGGSGGAGAPP